MQTKSQAELCRVLAVEFSQPELLTQALTHRSAGSLNNERLEYLGDSILGFVIAEVLFHKFPKEAEGKLSRLRASLVRGETLAEIGRSLDIGAYLHLGPGELKSGGYRRESILADAVEAVLGAYYLDSGMDASRELILNLFDERLTSINIDENIKDPKTQLQEWLQGRGHQLPVYTVKTVKMVDNEPQFEATCHVELLQKAVRAQGASHRKAERIAAEQALAELVKKT